MPVFGCNNEEIELVLCENECDYYEDGKCCGYVEYGYKFDKTSDDKGLSIAKTAAKDFLGIDGTWDIPRGRINLR